MHVEKQNHILRMHFRHPTRLTNAFSKKINAAAALNFAYYKFVKIHGSIRCTPARTAGFSPNIWNVSDLVEMITVQDLSPVIFLKTAVQAPIISGEQK